MRGGGLEEGVVGCGERYDAAAEEYFCGHVRC